MSDYSILGPLVLGIVIGLIELFLVHMDEAGMGWLTHGLHAIPVTIILLFISMNINWAISFIPGIGEPSMLIDIGLRVLIGIIATAKIKIAAAVVAKAGEKTIHALMIGVLIAIAPYIWDFALKPIFAGMNLPIQ